ncbi:MAG: hypothetical protein FJ109_18120, partial [Deltaproteobacteria bacterium]|nr:hypothetical protein [Deltaproteobacteria bacterium]
MKLHGRWCGWPFVLLCAMLLACGGGEESDGDVSAKDADSGLPEERTYAGFSSEGGEWTFLLEPAAWSLTFSKGNDAPMTRHYDLEDKAPLKFFLRVKDQGGELFGWEKPGRFLLHAFPLGTDKPSMFAAIGETAPAAPALVAGSYLWLEAGAAGDAGTPTFPAWGILTLSAEGAWSRWSFGTPAAEGGGIAPDSYTDAWPPASSPEAVGAWTQVAGTGKITLADGKTQLPGRVWTEEGTAVLVLQTESGMIVGVRAPEQPYVNSDLVN